MRFQVVEVLLHLHELAAVFVGLLDLDGVVDDAVVREGHVVQVVEQFDLVHAVLHVLEEAHFVFELV